MNNIETVILSKENTYSEEEGLKAMEAIMNGATLEDAKFEAKTVAEEEAESEMWDDILFGEVEETEEDKENKARKQKIIAALEYEISKLNNEITDLNSRVYKANNGTVYVGISELDGDNYNIGAINEKRRENKIKGAQEGIALAKKALDIFNNYGEDAATMDAPNSLDRREKYFFEAATETLFVIIRDLNK